MMLDQGVTIAPSTILLGQMTLSLKYCPKMYQLYSMINYPILK